MPIIAYLALGSNLGNRCLKIQKAEEAIGQWPKTRLLGTSALHEALPQGYVKQPKYLNCVLKIKTELNVKALLIWAKKTELELGRKPGFRWGPRKLDIDILFYGGKVVKNAIVTVPHPRLHRRAFVLAGLLKLCPGLIHPKLKLTVRQMWRRLSEAQRQSVWKLQ